MEDVWQRNAMIVAMMLFASTAAPSCDIANLRGANAVHEALGRRAIEIMGAAVTKGPKADAVLDKLVAPSAAFNLIIGDVGSPGTGIAGARSFADVIRADTYMFLGWDYMDIAVDPCGKRSITLDFINSRDKRIARITFVFEQAQLVAAEGWQHSFKSGQLPSPAVNANRK